MDQSESNITSKTPTEGSERPSLLRRIGRWIARSIVFLLLLIIFLSGGAFLATQTQWFRDIVRDRVLQLADENLAADVHFTRLGGNFLTGLTLDSLSVTAAGDTLLFTPQLSFRYDLMPLLQKTIFVDRIRIRQARIKLLQSPSDSTWNYEHITKATEPDPADTVEGAPFDWTIKVQGLVIDDAYLVHRALDTLPDFPEHDHGQEMGHVDFGNIAAENLTLSLSADLRPAENDFTATINGLGFYEANSAFRLRDLSGRVHLDRSGAELDNLRIYTDDSHLVVSAEMMDIDLLGGEPMENWESQPAAVQLDADSIATSDLHRFLPDLAFLDNSVGLKLDASGNYGDLKIAELDLRMRDSRVRLEGRLKNLHTPENLYIDATMDRTKLSYRDVQTHVPGLEIPDLSVLGTVHIDDAMFRGYPQNFNGRLDVKTDLGAFVAKGDLDVSGPEIVYDVIIDMQKANLGKWLEDPSMISNLNASVELRGRGLDLASMQADFKIKSKNTRLGDYRYASLLAQGNLSKKSTLTLDSLRITWPKAQFAEKSAPPPLLKGRGWMKLANLDNPAYNLGLEMRNVNLEEFFPGDTLPSAISGNIDINGIGFHPDSLELNLSADMNKLQIPGDTLAPLEFQAQLTRQSASERSFMLDSEIARVRLQGTYRFEALAASVNSVVDGVIAVIEDKYNTINSVVNDSTSMTFDLGMEETQERLSEPIDATFYVRLLDISPLKLFNQSERDLSADVKLLGSISGQTNDFLFELGEGSVVSQLEFRDGDTQIYVPPSDLGAMFRHERTDFGYSLLTGEFNFSSDSTLLLNDITLAQPEIGLSYSDENLEFNVATGILDDYYIGTEGTFDISGLDEYAIALNEFEFSYRDSLTWRARNKISANLTSSGVRLDSVQLQREGAERISLGGLISTENFSNTAITVENFTISNANKFLGPGPENQIDVLNQIEGDIDSLSVGLNGTWDSPIISLTMRADSLLFAGDYMGDNVLRVDYRDTTMTGSLEIFRGEGESRDRALLMSIDKLPIYLGLGERAEDADLLAPNRDVSISILADSISLGSLGLFVPSIDNIRGLANANFLIGGMTPNNLNYYGHVDILRSQMRVVSTNMLYGARGSITLNDDLLRVDSLMVINHPTDLPGNISQRKANIEGTIKFDGFDIDNFDIEISTDRFMVLNESSRATSPDLYGTLVIATRNQPLRLQGNLLRPRLSGAIEVLDGNLTLPMTRAQTKVRRTFCFERIIREDGSIYVTDRDCSDTLYKSTDRVDVVNTKDEAGNEQDRQLLEEELAFADRIYYNIRAWLKRDLTIRMPLGPLEELTTVVNLERPSEPLLYKSTDARDLVDKVEELYGTLQLKEGSKYDFYRSFASTGKVIFNGPPSEPEIRIVATLKATRIVDNSAQDYTVTITLSGTLEQLDIKFEYSINGEPARGTPDQITSNALSLIVFGKTLEELQGGGAGGLASGEDVVSNFSGSFTNKLASELLGDFLQDLGFIESVEVQLGQAQARVQVRGSVFNTGLGYRVDSDFGESGVVKITLDLPLSAITDLGLLRDLFFSFSGSTGAVNNTSRRNKEWEIKFGVKRSF